jgi:hypothetical protein
LYIEEVKQTEKEIRHRLENQLYEIQEREAVTNRDFESKTREWKEQQERHLQDVIDSAARQRAEEVDNYVRLERRMQD